MADLGVRVAVISDIHGNFAALRAIIQDLKNHHPDEVLVGGDLVLGGRQPAEVLNLLIERRWPAVLGNTDAFLLDLAKGTADPSDSDRSMAEWAIDRLQHHHLAYLNALPMSHRFAPPDNRGLMLVHATPWSISEMVLPDASEDVARRMLREGEADVIAYGHIHSPYYRRVNGGLLVSVGGVAWSNDRDPRPAYSVLSLGREVSVQVRRVSYDAGAEIAALDRSGLPLSAVIRKLLRSGGSLDRLRR